MLRIARVAGLSGIGAALLVLLVQPAEAQESGLSPETRFVFNTLSFLMSGFLVMWMAAGFAMLEAGLVRKRSVGTQLLKNISVYSVAGILFYLSGYSLMYDGVDGGFIGSFGIWSADDSAALAEQGADFEAGYAAASDWFFQMVFVATRLDRLGNARGAHPGLAVPAVQRRPHRDPVPDHRLMAVGRRLAQRARLLRFRRLDPGALRRRLGGARRRHPAGRPQGKFGPGGQVYPMLGSSLPLATLGTFILWLGWFGFNGGSQLALGSAADAVAVANIYVNTNLAAAGGLLAAMALTQIMYQKIDLTIVLNGAIAGLVSITAEPLAPSPGLAIVIGAVGGVLVVLAVPALYRLRIDDVVGAIPAHLVAGIWGTIAVPISNPDTSFATQLLGIAAIGAFTFVASLIVWSILKGTIGIRIADEDEQVGIDQVELGMEAYPEFGPSLAH